MKKEICECKRDYKSPLSGICELCWDEKYPDEEETIEESKKSFGEREFVDYTEALALKELGFDEPCLGLFDGTNNELHISSKPFQGNASFHYLAPIYQQAFRFFRENHGLIYSIGHIGHTNTWAYEIINMRIAGPDYGYGETYEEAELACLKKLIEIVKK